MDATAKRPKRPTRLIPPTPINHESNTEHIVEAKREDEETVLTPLRAHYLKKSLVQLQFAQELDNITTASPNNVSTFSFLGPPFSPPPKDAQPLDLPFLRYVFRQFVLTFPFMAAAPKDFYSEKLQPFMASVLSRNLSPTSVLEEGDEGSEQATRLKLLMKLERNLSLFVGSATKLVEREEVVRLSQSDLDRLEMLAQQRQARLNKVKDIFEVNIVSVRAVTDKGRMRSRVHEVSICFSSCLCQYSRLLRNLSYALDVLICPMYLFLEDMVTSRHLRMKLVPAIFLIYLLILTWIKLRKAHPNDLVRPPPAKDRTTVNAPQSLPGPVYMSRGSSAESQYLSTHSTMSEDSFHSQLSPSQTTFHTPSRLAREKNRLTLRAYLHSLMGSSAIASSPVLRSFLLSGPTSMSLEELEDAKRREEADKVRDDGRKRFAKEIAGRVDGLREAVKSVKGDVMGKGNVTIIKQAKLILMKFDRWSNSYFRNH